MRLVWAIRSRLLVLLTHTCPRTASSFGPRSTTATEVASGSPLLVDVEFGRGRRLYALSQGVGSGGPAGSPALPNTGALVRFNRDGTFTELTDGLNQPTSLESSGRPPTSSRWAGRSGRSRACRVRPTVAHVEQKRDFAA